jgi:hypothetical protein
MNNICLSIIKINAIVLVFLSCYLHLTYIKNVDQLVVFVLFISHVSSIIILGYYASKGKKDE